MKLATDDWPRELLHLLNRLDAAGREAVLVGGSVRDLLLGRSVHDWDVATSALPEEVMAICERSVPTGLKHGTVTVLEGDAAFEVTTYRTEGHYSDGRRPDYVSYTDRLAADLRRRDFTVNAIAAKADGSVIDPLAGLLDIERRQIRAVGDPLDRFSEDALRILRGLRLAAELGFYIEPGTLAAMTSACRLLQNIARERIGVELARLLTAGNTEMYKLVANGPWLGQLPMPWPNAAEALMRCPGIKLPKGESEEGTRLDHAVLPLAAVVAALGWQSLWNAATLRRAIRVMRWSNHVKRCALALLELLQSGLENWNTLDWQKHLLYDGPVLVETASRIHAALNESAMLQRFLEEGARQTIQSPQELSISGADLVELGAAGPEVGLLKARVIERVLSGALKNESECLIRFAVQELLQMRTESGDEGDQNGAHATGRYPM